MMATNHRSLDPSSVSQRNRGSSSICLIEFLHSTANEHRRKMFGQYSAKLTIM